MGRLLTRTVGLYFTYAADAESARVALRACGVEGEIASAPAAVDGADGTLVALELQGDLVLTMRLAHDHGGIVVADVPDEWIRPPLD